MTRTTAMPMRPNKKLLILGHARHGKDTVAEMICNELPWYNFTSSSEFAQKIIQPALLASVYKDEPSFIESYNNIEKAIFEDRVNYRDAWKEFISLVNHFDKAALARAIMKENDIYVGMRSQDEFNACMEAKIFDHIIYVHAHPRVPTFDQTFKIAFTSEPVAYINNSSCIADTVGQVKSMIKNLQL